MRDHDPMIPHTLVLKPGLVIHSVYNGYWFWRRPSLEDLRHDLREVTREIRSDWDLSTPGLREAWEPGDRSAFFHDVDLDPALRMAQPERGAIDGCTHNHLSRSSPKRALAANTSCTGRGRDDAGSGVWHYVPSGADTLIHDHENNRRDESVERG